MHKFLVVCFRRTGRDTAAAATNAITRRVSLCFTTRRLGVYLNGLINRPGFNIELGEGGRKGAPSVFLRFSVPQGPTSSSISTNLSVPRPISTCPAPRYTISTRSMMFVPNASASTYVPPPLLWNELRLLATITPSPRYSQSYE